MGRVSIPAKLRFEVFKRDSFKCVYCGASAPDVILHVDHVIPVSKGGTNDIMNLVTACEKCNLGKSDVMLSDRSAIKKKKAELDRLNERRAQIEMMLEWQKSLIKVDDTLINGLNEIWEDLTGKSFTDYGKKMISRYVRKYGIADVVKAMKISVDKYGEYNSKGMLTTKSTTEAFNRIPGICKYAGDKDMQATFYLRKILLNRGIQVPKGYFEIMKRYMAKTDPYHFDYLISKAKRCSDYEEFLAAIKSVGV